MTKIKGLSMGITKDKNVSSSINKLRRRAEDRLRTKTAVLHPPRTEKDALRLVNELEVHQIELEMQNAELRQAQEEIELSRNKYTELYDFAPIGYFTFDKSGRIRELNHNGAQLLGMEKRLLANKPFNSFIADDAGKKIFSNHLVSVLQKQGTQRCEIGIKTKGGKVIHGQLQSVMLNAVESKDNYILSSIFDGTEQKEAEAKIEHLASFPELNPNPVIETDYKGKVIYFNSAAKKMLMKLNLPEDGHFFLPPDLTKIIKQLQQENEGRYVLRDVEINGRVFMESIIAPARLKIVRLYAHDITRRKQAEEALRDSEKLYRAIGESINYGIWVCNPDGRNIYASESFLKLVGLTQKQCSDFGWGDVIHPDDSERTMSLWKECVRNEGIWDIEHRFRGVDGHWHYILARGLPVRNDKGKIIYWAGINLDISRIKQAEEEIKKAYTVLDEKVKERTSELSKANEQLHQEIGERKRVEKSLRKAVTEIKTMKDQLEAENIYFRQENKLRNRYENILGQSDGLQYVLYRAEQVAPQNTTVLILGETGTGKELIAFAIHNMSPRRERPLITVNCAALPGNLIESELFGREKGAFTGADTRQIGRFEIANGSTICLDEIGELPLELQAKLLRVVQHGEFERLGSSHTIKVDVRIIATTNRDIEEEVRQGRFRQDLYYRLNTFPVTVPPLRQRKEDIPLLVDAFTERYSKKMGKQINLIHNDTMKALQDYPWPGNVRELESIIERAVILSSGPVLQLTDKLEISSPILLSAVKTLEDTERNQIIKILSETVWRIEGKNGAAAILGIHSSTLRARMHKLGIVRPDTK
jgi:formate hydrogenlyase transcriptional activator